MYVHPTPFHRQMVNACPSILISLKTSTLSEISTVSRISTLSKTSTVSRISTLSKILTLSKISTLSKTSILSRTLSLSFLVYPQKKFLILLSTFPRAATVPRRWRLLLGKLARIFVEVKVADCFSSLHPTCPFLRLPARISPTSYLYNLILHLISVVVMSRSSLPQMRRK